MDMALKDGFIERWGKHFPGAELPIAFYYAEDGGEPEPMAAPGGWRCFIADLAKVRKGETVCFDVDSISCSGGKRYLGFSQELMPNFEYFLSCGLEGVMEGERYKKNPGLVKSIMNKVPEFVAPASRIVFKRWDMLEADDTPEVVVFFAPADVLSGLFTLANFDEPSLEAVFSPFAAGCGSIAMYPYIEKQAERPRAVFGMFDVSARPCVQSDVLTFAVCMEKFERMAANMDESFLITKSWAKVRERMSG